VRKTKKCDSKNFFEKHNGYIVCNEKMAMECMQVSKLEMHTGNGIQEGEHVGA
jgi:hypothetical protein